jgi:predicted DNA-binding protein
MRVTIDIPDEIHARLKALAKKEGTTMRAIILSGIEAVLRERSLLARAEPLGSGGKEL